MANLVFKVTILFSLLFAPSAWADDFKYLQGMNNPDVFKVNAAELGRSFNIYVRVPMGYKDITTPLPTVYLLDGGHTFPMLSSYYQYLAFGEEVPEMIIVGISYGTDTFEGGNHRGSDFTAPAESRAHYGGASKFQSFLKEELLPLIEEKYRSDPAKRIIFGQSLGGQFVLFTAQTQPDLFWGHIASNPALHRNLDFFLENRPAKSEANSLLFVSSGTKDDERFLIPAVQWMKHWQKADGKPWLLKAIDLPGHGHFSAAPAAFRSGLNWFFNDAQQ